MEDLLHDVYADHEVDVCGSSRNKKRREQRYAELVAYELERAGMKFKSDFTLDVAPGVACAKSVIY